MMQPAMPRQRKHPGVYPRVLKRRNVVVYDARVTWQGIVRTRRGFANPRQAHDWQRETWARLKGGEDTRSPAKMTVGDLVWQRWLPVKLAELRAETSRSTYTYRRGTMTDGQAEATWHKHEIRDGHYSFWSVADENNRHVAQCLNESDCDAIIAGHEAAARVAALERRLAAAEQALRAIDATLKERILDTNYHAEALGRLLKG